MHTKIRDLLPAVLSVLCLSWMGMAHAQGLPASVLKQLDQVQIDPASVSVWASDSTHPEEPWINWNSQVWRTPASVEKIFTTLAGLDMLGPDYRWVTRFYTLQAPEDGTLRSAVFIRGGGDPKWTSSRALDAMSDLQALGIRRLEGDWVFDRSAFSPTTRSAGSLDGEVLRPYNARPDALALNFKSVILKITPRPQTRQALVSIDPPIEGLKWTSEVPLTDKPCRDWRQELRADLSNGQHWRLRGSYSGRCGTQEWPVAFPDAEQHTSRAWQALWKASNGEQTGHARDGSVPAQSQLILSKASLPLHSIVEDINKFSNNLMAQHLWLTLDPAFHAGQEATFDGARAAWVEWWLTHVYSSGMVPWIDNGSGLSRVSRSTVRSLSDALLWAWHQPFAPAFVNSLPLLGVDGTTRNWGQDGSMNCSFGKARVKTGSLRDVLSVSGYIPTSNGQTRVFTAIINHDRAAQGRMALRELIEWVCLQPPLSTPLLP